MSTISLDTFEDLGLATTTSSSSTSSSEDTNELDQSDFLELMTEQLSEQDPFEPQDNGEFIAQMAQFSTLSAMDELTNSFTVLAQSLSQGQAVQAAAMVGRDVLVPTEFGELSEGGTITGSVDLETSAQTVTIDVLDESGATVTQIVLEDAEEGLNDFEWDGLLSDGSSASSGVYEFSATATGSDESEAAEVYVNGTIDSVSVDEDGVLWLDVVGIGEVEFEDIRRID